MSDTKHKECALCGEDSVPLDSIDRLCLECEREVADMWAQLMAGAEFYLSGGYNRIH